MRKLKFMAFLMAVPLLMTVGCKKKDKNDPQPQPEPNVPEEKYLGTWNGEDQKYVVSLGGMPMLNEESDLAEGEFVLVVHDDNTLKLTFIEPGATETSVQTQTYTKISNYSIKFNVDVEEMELSLEATFNVDESNLQKAKINIDQDGVVIDENLPPARVELLVNLKK